MADSNLQAEPSMEEILTSIRRIIVDGDPAVAAAPAATPAQPSPSPGQAADGEAPLLLTDIVDEPSASPTQQPPTLGGLALGPTRDKPLNGPTTDRTDDLLSPGPAGTSMAAFARAARAAAPDPRQAYVAGQARSLEDTVSGLLQPMLKEWLNQHLPAIVERIVEQEVKKLIRRAENS